MVVEILVYILVDELQYVFGIFGEVCNVRMLVCKIVEVCEQEFIEKVGDLVVLVEFLFFGKFNCYLVQVFQVLCIVVNDEMGVLEEMLM